MAARKGPSATRKKLQRQKKQQFQKGPKARGKAEGYQQNARQPGPGERLEAAALEGDSERQNAQLERRAFYQGWGLPIQFQADVVQSQHQIAVNEDLRPKDRTAAAKFLLAASQEQRRIDLGLPDQVHAHVHQQPPVDAIAGLNQLLADLTEDQAGTGPDGLPPVERTAQPFRPLLVESSEVDEVA